MCTVTACEPNPCLNDGLCNHEEDPHGWGFHCMCRVPSGGRLCQYGEFWISDFLFGILAITYTCYGWLPTLALAQICFKWLKVYADRSFYKFRHFFRYHLQPSTCTFIYFSGSMFVSRVSSDYWEHSSHVSSGAHGRQRQILSLHYKLYRNTQKLIPVVYIHFNFQKVLIYRILKKMHSKFDRGLKRF